MNALHWMALWFVTFKLGEIGSFGEWTWFEILAPFWINLAAIFVIEFANRLAEKNETK